MKYHQIAVPLTESEKEMLEEYCRINDLPKGKVARRAILAEIQATRTLTPVKEA